MLTFSGSQAITESNEALSEDTSFHQSTYHLNLGWYDVMEVDNTATNPSSTFKTRSHRAGAVRPVTISFMGNAEGQ